MRKKRDKDGLHKRQNSPYWYASFTDASGQCRKRSTGTDCRAEAQRLLNQWRWEADQARGIDREPERTLHELIMLYVEAHSSKPSLDRDGYSCIHLYRIIGEQRIVNRLKPTDMHSYVQQRQSEGAQNATINKEIGLLSASLNWARHHLGWDVPNPAQRHRLPEPPGRDRWLTEDEAGRLLEAARLMPRAPHLADFIVLGINTGMRPGEMLALEWSRVELGNHRIMLGVDDQKARKVGQVPLNGQARDALLNRARFRATYCPDAPWVFCTKAGRRIASVKTSFRSACRQAGIEDCHPHDLRRTCGSWLVGAGVSLHIVSRLLRHSDIRVTEAVYAHLAPEHLADAVKVLEQVNRDTKSTKTKVSL